MSKAGEVVIARPAHPAVPNRRDFVEAAPTLPCDPRIRLPPASPHRYHGEEMDGLSPPYVTIAPRGAGRFGSAKRQQRQAHAIKSLMMWLGRMIRPLAQEFSLSTLLTKAARARSAASLISRKIEVRSSRFISTASTKCSSILEVAYSWV